MANLLHLTDVVIERANRLCEDVYHSRDHSNKLKAHSHDAIRSACLNIACRYHSSRENIKQNQNVINGFLFVC
jgi:hypothetical protein